MNIQEVILKLLEEYLTDMKRLLYIFMILLCTSCVKGVLQPVSVDLGSKKVGVEAGSFPVRITVEGVWYAESQVAWLKVDESLHDSDGTFTIRYESNTSSEGDWRFNRSGIVLVKTYDGAVVGTIKVLQKGMTPEIRFADMNRIPTAGGQCKVACVTNLTDSERSGISFKCQEKWIKDICWSRDGRSVDFVAEAGGPRQALITMIYTDAWGQSVEVEFIVSQEE